MTRIRKLFNIVRGWLTKRFVKPMIFLWSAISAAAYFIFELKMVFFRIIYDDYYPTNSELYALIIMIIILAWLLLYIIKVIIKRSWKHKPPPVDLEP